MVADLRLTFGWARSPGFLDLMSVAAEHALCHTPKEDARTSTTIEGAAMMAQVRIVEPWGIGKSTAVLPAAGVNAAKGGGFFVNPYLLPFMKTIACCLPGYSRIRPIRPH